MHNYVADEPKSESRPHLIQNFDKAISCPPRAKQWPPAITAKSHEVKVAASIVAPQRIPHERTPAPLRTKGAAPNCENYHAAEGCAWKKPHP